MLAGNAPILVHNCGTDEATVYLANYADGRQHALITIRDAEGEISTHQFGDVSRSDNGVEAFNPSDLPAITLRLNISLPFAGRARMFVENALFKTGEGRWPPYSLPDQGCVTYCAQVLEAGGLDGIPLDNDEAQSWLMARYG
ncbi:hypothetical protein ACGFYY_24520 [Streptomyces sp. NPDC048331]|uniref:hypothetical protein n=1 Tax=Streptomyces sp. NPDC048331 TaxID=3365534 RepID=UPI003716E712